MFGQVEALPPGGESIPIRGGRLRTVLGLLVADRMLRKPLGHREFCYIAAGSDDDLDPENARKTMNNAIFRLRELLGDDAISTEGETPQLNPACIEVDLLVAYELLGQAERDARDDALMRAVPALRRALELSHGEVPFPALYEDFFEALREDFENRLRSAAIDVAARLLRAGDAAGAEDLLRPALDAIPEDEELVEMLYEALTKLGRRAEAARLKISETVAQTER
jgi:DNA-binding SARP family transcriptional activator